MVEYAFLCSTNIIAVELKSLLPLIKQESLARGKEEEEEEKEEH